MSSGMQSLFARAAAAAIPIEVSLELTRRCNLSCGHCYMRPGGRTPELSTARWLRLLDELVDMGTLFLAITGGEPLLHRDWHVIARRARTLGFAVRLQSNATLIGEAEAELLARLGLTVEATILGVDDDAADGITGKRGSAAKVREAVERLRAADVRVVLKMPLMAATADGSSAVQAYGDSIGAEVLVSHRITARRNGDVTPITMGMKHTQLVEHLGGPHFDLEGLRRPAAIQDDRPLCAAASSFCHITASGDVLACNLLPRSAGNISDSPFCEIWSDSPWLTEVRGIRSRHLKDCAGCRDLEICGRCHAQALLEDGDLYGPSRTAGRFAAAVHAALEANSGS